VIDGKKRTAKSVASFGGTDNPYTAWIVSYQQLHRKQIMAKSSNFRVVSTEERTDGYNDVVTVSRFDGDAHYGDLTLHGGAAKAKITYKGRTRTKTFVGEMAHADMERWIGDTTVPLILGVRKSLV